MTPTDATEAFVASYLAERADAPKDLDRLVEKSSGLRAAEMIAVLEDTTLGDRGLEVMADFMHPTDSRYFDAIYGSTHGQLAIRQWLLPVMAEIDFIEFRPQFPGTVFQEDGGESSVDEWQMVGVIDGLEIPFSKGVSVRNYRDGWITWACDVYDTGSFRTPVDGAEAPELPPVPHEEWPRTEVVHPPLSEAALAWVEKRKAARDGDGGVHTEPSGLSHADIHAIIHHPDTAWDFDLFADLFHPTEGRYLDPIFGEFTGQADVRPWLVDVMAKVGTIEFESVGPIHFDGNVSAQEWVQVAVAPDGTRHDMLRGTSVRRIEDGWITYAADYFDTAALTDPAVMAAAQAAGSTLTLEDIERYRR